MSASTHFVSAALIAGMQCPLRLGQGYIISWDGGSVPGSIHSVLQRLPSPFVASSSGDWVHPRQMAHAKIKILSATPPPAALRGGAQPFTVVEPATKAIAGAGLLIPGGTHDGDGAARPAGLTVWLTGLSGAGKTTIALQVQNRLLRWSAAEMLDADIVRRHLCKDLGYSREDRDENVRRLGFAAGLLTQAGLIVLTTAIAPYRATREEVRRTIGKFIEVYVNAPLTVCEQRDVKGLYKRARAGEIRSFTGVDDPYEAPLSPEVECQTDRESIETSVSKVIAAIMQRLGANDAATASSLVVEKKQTANQ